MPYDMVDVSANLAPRKEENTLLPGTNAKPGDVFVPHWMDRGGVIRRMMSRW